MTFLLNHRPVDALALIVHAKAVEETGRYWVEKLCALYIASLRIAVAGIV